MTTKKDETGKFAAPLAAETKYELTEDEMARVSGGRVQHASVKLQIERGSASPLLKQT